jgi:hypothetical protein
MQEDETQQDGVVEEPAAEVTEATEAQEETVVEEKEEGVDYRGKLNATNNFLKKEGYEFKDGKWVPPTKSVTEVSPQGVNPADTIVLAAAIAKGTVDADDIERVQKFAKDEGISIQKALNNSELKAILAVRAEERTTANAANVGNVRRGPAKVSDEALVANASAGKLPDDDEGIARLVAAKAKQRD